VITVAKSKITDKKTKENRVCKYSDVPTDPQKWVYDLKYMPIPYDLMFLRFKNSPKIKSGWWNGIHWEGLRLEPQEIVIAWKRNYPIEL
jgi:hypothetical protein